MNKRYIVRLTDAERAICEATIKKEKGTSEKLRGAMILLKADAKGPAWHDTKISEAVGWRTRTVENVRQAFVLEDFEAALARKKRVTPPTPKLLDGAPEAKLIALRLGKPLVGFGHWTLRLLQDQMVELEIMESISPETVRQTQKNGMTKRKKRVLGDSSRRRRRVRRQHGGGAGDARKSLRRQIAGSLHGRAARATDRRDACADPGDPGAYRLRIRTEGDGQHFSVCRTGFRQATARPRRTKDDWAHEVADLLDTRYAGVARITLVCDNLNTHTKGSFYEAFPPDRVREYVRRINFVYTPKHGSWLNVAECELS